MIKKYRFLPLFIIGVAATQVAITPAYAVDDCALTLIPRVTTNNTTDITHLALAWELSARQLDEKSRSAGGEAVIYGIPFKGNYDDYKKKVSERAESLGYKNFKFHTSAYSTTGLDENNFNIYAECKRATAFGLLIFPRKANDSNYTVLISYNPHANSKTKLKAKILQTTNLTAASVANLKTFEQGYFYDAGKPDHQRTLSPLDPKLEISFDIQVGDQQSRAITLPPLAKPVPGPDSKTAKTSLTRPDYDGDGFVDKLDYEGTQVVTTLAKDGIRRSAKDLPGDYIWANGTVLNAEVSGDGCSDLVHITSNQYAEIHISSCDGTFKFPRRFNFPPNANPQSDYNVNLGSWSVSGCQFGAPAHPDPMTVLVHHWPTSPTGPRTHYWIPVLGSGGYAFAINAVCTADPIKVAMPK